MQIFAFISGRWILTCRYLTAIKKEGGYKIKSKQILKMAFAAGYQNTYIVFKRFQTLDL
jgi:hypothetical protein